MDKPHITCFLRNRGEILLTERGDGTDADADRWSALVSHADGDPDEAAHEAVRGWTDGDAVSFVRRGEPFVVEADRKTRRRIHPYLFDYDSRMDEIGGTDTFEWLPPTEIHHRETVPGLWNAYERVAPTVETVREDGDHGSAYLSVRALEVLRDRAGVLATEAGDETDRWNDLAALAHDLREARPSMVVVENRVDRAMDGVGRTPEAVEESARAGIERAFDADANAAHEAATLLDGTVLTLSRSGTVLDALRQADIERVIVAESRPAREGVGVAETLAEECRVTLVTDAAVAHVLAEHTVDSVLVGADTILADGSVVNKVGTWGIAIAAAREDVSVYAVAANDKITTGDARFEDGDPRDVYDGDAAIDVVNPTFDRTPAELITVVTEDGPLDAAAVEERAARLDALASW